MEGTLKPRILALVSLAFVFGSCAALNDTGSTGKRVGMVEESPQAEDGSLETLIKEGPSQIAPSAAERDLYRRIMEYRKANGLPMIDFSKSLTYVAKLHVRDLETHTFAPGYNSHSWSNDGPWTSVNYSPDHRNAKGMWDKPRELTRYVGSGFEIAYWSSAGATPSGALSSWKTSSGHNAVILNEGIWKSSQWKAIGIGVFGDYAVVWFGDMKDPETALSAGK
jgi:uncharacterized protein YkwD